MCRRFGVWSPWRMVHKFVVDGTPRGYCIQMGRYQNTKVKRRYVAYKQLVQAVADLSGLVLPLQASKEKPIRVFTRAYFETGVHPDPENVHKGVKDALFYKAGGVGDKYTGGAYEPPLYDAERPRVEIEVFIP